MFVGSSDKVYIIDKVEGNAHQIGGHGVYASVWYGIPLFCVTSAYMSKQGHQLAQRNADRYQDQCVLCWRDAPP